MKFLMLSALFITSAYGDYNSRIRDCGPKATKEMAKVRKFLTENVEEIFEKTPDLTNKERKNLRKRLKKVKIKCSDKRSFCKQGRTLGMEMSVFNTSIHLCYNRIQKNYDNNAFCKLADTVMHEMGHSAGVKKAPDHNRGPNNDRVYRLGAGVNDLCNDLDLDRKISANGLL